jgi:thiopurine S-methyltransferase
MDASFWHERWQTYQIGFHKSEVNPILLRHVARLSPMKAQSVFVPLCGKTKDLVWWRD